MQAAAEENVRLDPAAWGRDHVGRQLPEYITGDECLFCHRDIGPVWNENRHQLTIRPAGAGEPALAWLSRLAAADSIADQTQYLLGSRRKVRFLKRSNEYGKLDILSLGFAPQAPPSDRVGTDDEVHWDKTRFADRCAGCHATAVDSQTRAFSGLSLDCYTCHGEVPLAHTDNVGLALLSSKNRQPRVVISICGQCHLRGGRSVSSGLPYPNHFVAGDNLFRDFQVDFSAAAIAALPAGDRHVYQNARDVAVLGRSKMTCLTCHDVHSGSSEKHQGLADTALCASCHRAGSDNTRLIDAMLTPNRLREQSRTCDY